MVDTVVHEYAACLGGVHEHEQHRVLVVEHPAGGLPLGAFINKIKRIK
jgi:hypothetical protein